MDKVSKDAQAVEFSKVHVKEVAKGKRLICFVAAGGDEKLNQLLRSF